MSSQKEAMEIISRNAQESGNPHAFYSGMVVGLGHAYEWIRMSDRETVTAHILALLDMLDDEHFKKEQI